jgi:hypothetical protein
VILGMNLHSPDISLPVSTFVFPERDPSPIVVQFLFVDNSYIIGLITTLGIISVSLLSYAIYHGRNYYIRTNPMFSELTV